VATCANCNALKCASAPCKDCKEIEKDKELHILIRANGSRRKELDAEIQKLKDVRDLGIVVKQVHPDDDTTQSYFMV
jgi:hypothetical protein